MFPLKLKSGIFVLLMLTEGLFSFFLFFKFILEESILILGSFKFISGPFKSIFVLGPFNSTFG